MPLATEVRAILDEKESLGLPPLNTLSPAQAREQMRSLAPPVDRRWAVQRVVDRSLPVESGEILTRFYYPSSQEPLPVVVYFHGGGWVVGDLETHQAICHALAHQSGCLVAAVDYRLAPEYRFPVAVEDAYSATCWVAEHAETLGADRERIAVVGDSAGGNLAAVVSLLAGSRQGPRLGLQVLVYPITDCDFDRPSYRDNAVGYSLTRELMVWFWEQYIERPQQANDPRVSPLRAESLRGVPEALVITAEFDPLRDEGEAYAQRLEKEGVSVTLSRYDGMIHGFFSMTAQLEAAREALSEVARALKRSFGGDS